MAKAKSASNDTVLLKELEIELLEDIELELFGEMELKLLEVLSLLDLESVEDDEGLRIEEELVEDPVYIPNKDWHPFPQYAMRNHYK